MPIPPLGVSPLGTFSETERAPMPPPPVIRADYINPATGEYVSLIADLHPVDAQVVDALWRVKKSGSSVQTIGATFNTVRKLGDGVERELILIAHAALRRLIENEDITLERVTPVITGDTAEVTVDYVNNRRHTDKRQSAVVRISGAML